MIFADVEGASSGSGSLVAPPSSAELHRSLVMRCLVEFVSYPLRNGKRWRSWRSWIRKTGYLKA